MGTSESSLSTNKKNKKSAEQITPEYQSCFNQCKTNPNFFKNLLTQCPTFTKNLLKLFPNAFTSYQNFYDMILYLRKYDVTNNRHQMAKNNAGSTTLLDRFFMICLNIQTSNQFSMTTLSLSNAKELLEYYMQLFISNPKIESMEKILGYINIPNIKQINAKEYSSSLREHFPHIQKFLIDYIKSKCRDCNKNGLLLKNFNSKIIKEDAVLLSLRISQIARKQTTLLYSTESSGLSFHSLEKNIVGYTGYWLLIAQHTEKNEKGDRDSYIFGAYQNGPIREVNTFQGDLTGFLFSIHPKIRLMTTDKGDNESNYFFINSIDEKISKKRKGLGFGGNKFKQNCKLWIDQDIDRSMVFNGNDPTYGFGCLTQPSTQKLNIKVMEIWGLGNEGDIKNQQNYWAEREAEIMKRRKVNKKELIDGNANIVFEKTFAHRDQVYGEIEKREEQEK